jgi:cytochrome c oxidase assembly protein subunit 15
MIASLQFLGKDNKLVALSIGVFVLVGLQGWMGSIVVSTNLLPWTITVHMLLALLIVTMLIHIVFRARKFDFRTSKFSGMRPVQALIILCLIMVGVQILMGTQVREAIDLVAVNLSNQMRETWVAQTGLVFLVHRSFSIALLILHAILVWYLIKNREQGSVISRAGLILITLVIVEIGSGVLMAYFGIPPFLQPIHLVLSTLIFGALYFMLLLSARQSEQLISVSNS